MQLLWNFSKNLFQSNESVCGRRRKKRIWKLPSQREVKKRGKQEKKDFITSKVMILVCDAGAPLEQSFIAKQLSPWRLKHITDIISDQSRALRVRSFINFSKNNPKKGFYIYIKESKIPKENENASFTQAFPTTLKKLNEKQFDMLLEHGYEACKVRMVL